MGDGNLSRSDYSSIARDCDTDYSLCIETPVLCPQIIQDLMSSDKLSSIIILTLAWFPLLSNSIFLGTVLKQRSLREKSRLCVYLVTLSCIDICVSICFVLVSCRLLINLANGVYSLSVFSPYLLRFPLQLMSAILIVALTVERYMAVSRPFRRMRASHNPRLLYIAAGTMLAVSLVVTLFSFIQSLLTFDQQYRWECQIGNKVYKILTPRDEFEDFVSRMVIIVTYLLVIADVVTLVTSACLLALIYRTLSRAPDLGVTRYHKEQRNLTRMIVINTTLFCVCILFQDIFVWLAFHSDIFLGHFGKYFHLVVSSLTLFNSGVNPIIYNVFSSRYRQGFWDTFPCLLRLGKCRRPYKEDIGTETTNRKTQTTTL